MKDITEFKNQYELFKFLVTNKKQLIAEKKFTMKKADSISYTSYSYDDKNDAVKAYTADELISLDRIKVRLVMNTTNLLDSHHDVHINGLWKKTLKEVKSLYHLQEHEMKFDHVISDLVTPFTKKMSWQKLGYDFEGETEALIFESEIEKARNPFMFEQYARGYVKNHSVGMRYVNLFLCINSTEEYYKEEKTNWDKYIESVVNKDEAEKSGYFWAVTEGKLIEGSAVLLGSNWATPTQSIEPSSDTPKSIMEPVSATPKHSLFEKLTNLKS